MFWIVIGLLFTVYCSEGRYNIYPRIISFSTKGNVGKPLFLTPLIENREIKYARELAKVDLHETDIKSYSGLITVNKKYNSNMFFWFFPAKKRYSTAPVALWLQGGPGSSSLFGLFDENGPFYVDKKQKLKPRNTSWNKIANMIYIDNPVGTGFSFTDNDEGYARNMEDVGTDLYAFLIQFFQLFPELQKSEFFLTGESYAGKYIPAAAHIIDINNKKSDMKINLKGMAIGNGLCDPEHMTIYGDFLYQIGLIDFNGRLEFYKIEEKIIKLIKEKYFEAASEYMTKLMFGHTSLFYNLTGFNNVYNFLHNNGFSTYGDYYIFVQNNNVRKSIHVGNLTFNTGDSANEALRSDISKSIKPWIEELIENYRIIFYSGQLDIIIPFPQTQSFLSVLEWSGSMEYKNVVKKRWYVGRELAGYFKTVRNMTEILVRNAGHMVPTDQPKWAFKIFKNLITNKGF